MVNGYLTDAHLTRPKKCSPDDGGWVPGSGTGRMPCIGAMHIDVLTNYFIQYTHLTMVDGYQVWVPRHF
jgi:hypothetical protein